MHGSPQAAACPSTCGCPSTFWLGKKNVAPGAFIAQLRRRQMANEVDVLAVFFSRQFAARALFFAHSRQPKLPMRKFCASRTTRSARLYRRNEPANRTRFPVNASAAFRTRIVITAVDSVIDRPNILSAQRLDRLAHPAAFAATASHSRIARKRIGRLSFSVPPRQHTSPVPSLSGAFAAPPKTPHPTVLREEKVNIRRMSQQMP